MEVEDSPLNLAHQQSRKADRLLAAGKYEEAISCHSSAADLLRDAMKLTDCEQARLSLELQKDSHIKQQRLIQERWKRASRRGAKPPGPAAPAQPPLPPQPPAWQSAGAAGGPGAGGRGGEREYDTLLYQLQRRSGVGLPPPAPGGAKTAKDDKTRLEEQQTTTENLRRLLGHLTDENQRLSSENRRLRTENARLRSEAAEAAEAAELVARSELVERSELWVLPPAVGGGGAGGAPPPERTASGKGKDIAIPQLPPLEMPAQEDLCLAHLTQDIQQELQELLDTDKL